MGPRRLFPIGRRTPRDHRRSARPASSARWPDIRRCRYSHRDPDLSGSCVRYRRGSRRALPITDGRRRAADVQAASALPKTRGRRGMAGSPDVGRRLPLPLAAAAISETRHPSRRRYCRHRYSLHRQRDAVRHWSLDPALRTKIHPGKLPGQRHQADPRRFLQPLLSGNPGQRRDRQRKDASLLSPCHCPRGLSHSTRQAGQPLG